MTRNPTILVVDDEPPIRRLLHSALTRGGYGVIEAEDARTALAALPIAHPEAQKVAALDLGADDYVTKPFDTEEVSARIRAALRHRLASETNVPVVKVGAVEIDLLSRTVTKAGREVHLTPKEYGFLAELAKQPGKVATHAHLLRSVWGAGHESDVEYLRVAARGLRKKLEEEASSPSIIRNEPGVGYRLVGAK